MAVVFEVKKEIPADIAARSELFSLLGEFGPQLSMP